MSAFAAVVRVGVGCLITNPLVPNSVLFGVRLGSHGAGKFALPGGHLDMGESWAECAAREVKEETNLDIEDLKLVKVTNDIMANDKHYITIFMSGKLCASSAELINMEPHKCEEWKWVPWSDIVDLRKTNESKLFEPMVNLIDTLGEEQTNPPFLTQDISKQTKPTAV